MAHDEKTITIEDRGQTLTFVIRPMPPIRLEQWLLRALRSMVRDPQATGADYMAAGKQLAAEGLWKLVRAAEPDALFALSDQLLESCSRRVGNAEMRCTPETLDSYVQEVTTLFTLKNEALKCNLEFLSRADEALAATAAQGA